MIYDVRFIYDLAISRCKGTKKKAHVQEMCYFFEKYLQYCANPQDSHCGLRAWHM